MSQYLNGWGRGTWGQLDWGQSSVPLEITAPAAGSVGTPVATVNSQAILSVAAVTASLGSVTVTIQADLPLKPETDKLLLLTGEALPKRPSAKSKETDRLLFVDKVAVPKADVLAKPSTEILFTEVVVAVPRLPAANRVEGVTLASA